MKLKVVPLHSKEKIDFGKKFYSNIFGKDLYGKTWIFSSDNL